MRTIRSCLFAAAALAACASPERPADTPAAPVAAVVPAPGSPANAAPIAPAWPVDDVFASNAGTYVVGLRRPAEGWKRGRAFALEVRIADAARPDVPLRDVALRVEAWMPEHLHGMNRVPRIEQRADGIFVASGLYFHMPGWWDLHLDVTRGAWTERAQLRVDLE